MQTALPLLARPSQSKSCWPHLCHRSLLHLRRSNGIGKEQNLFEQASSYKFFLHGAWSACDPASQVFNPGSCIICQIKERLPRIARLAYLNTQTPRTPRTPRAKNSTTTAENKRVGRRWSPPGGLQYYFLCRRPRTKLQQQVGRRLEQGWPYSAAPPGTSVLDSTGQELSSIAASKVFA